MATTGGDAAVVSSDAKTSPPSSSRQLARPRSPEQPPPSQAHLSRNFLDSLQWSSSVILRFAVFIFLRWIPTSLAWPLIPAAYSIYLASWLLKDHSVKRLLASWNNEVGSSDLKELATAVTVTKPEIGEQVGNSHKAQYPSPSIFSMAYGLISGLSIRSRRVNLLNLGLHTLAFAFFLDSYASPYIFPSHFEHNLIFHRIADVGPTHSKVHLRWPEPIPLFEGLEETSEGSGILRDGMVRSASPLRLVYREITPPLESKLFVGASNRWERGPLVPLSEQDDWTATVSITNLWPNTEYEYRLAWAHNNTFISPHRLIEFEQQIGTDIPASADLLSAGNTFVGGRFRTWPDPRTGQGMGGLALAPTFAMEEDILGDQVPLNDPNHFKFVTSSCVKPDFPYSPASFPVWNWALQLLRPSSSSSSTGDAHTDTFARRNVVKGFDLMYDRYIRGKEQPNVRFFLQLGDLIYADVPKKFSTAVVQGYRKLYRNLYASASFRRVFERIPMIGIYDDHEVKNNWAGLTTDGKVIEEFPPANTAWQEYVGRANPDSLEEGEHHFTFRYGSETAFFVFDTRRHREPSSGFSEEEEEEAAENNYHHIDGQPFKTMLGQRQKEQFIQWLGAVNSTATFKFVVSSVPFMSLWGGAIDIDGKKDSWAAYLEEREELLDIMQYVKGSVIVLSGDRHEFASTGLRSLDYPHPDSHPITEFSTSPLSMFYLPVRTLSQSHGRGPTGQEKLLKYIPDGNYKWTDFEVDTRDPSHPHVIARVFVDGEMAWKVKLLGRSVREGQARTVGGLAKSFLELLGWKSRKWF